MTDAERDALYAQYPNLKASMELAAYCDYYNRQPSVRRAYATGLGPEAHAEAQEAGRLQEEYERSRTEPREHISRGGKKA